MYVVRLGAWNCTCAAFAFAAFPGDGMAFVEGDGDVDMDMDMDVGEDDDDGTQSRDDGEWSFGGMSLGDGVPCCKHLLACLLAERWSAALGEYVEERKLGTSEMAGIVADI